MKYKGYTGAVEWDPEIKQWCGSVRGIRDVITFYGNDMADAIRQFRESVDDYLDFCLEGRGEKPETPPAILALVPSRGRFPRTESEDLKLWLTDYFTTDEGPPQVIIPGWLFQVKVGDVSVWFTYKEAVELMTGKRYSRIPESDHARH